VRPLDNGNPTDLASIDVISSSTDRSPTREAETAGSPIQSAPVMKQSYRPRRGLSIPSITVLDASDCVIEAEQRMVFRYNAQTGMGADIIFGAGTNGEWNRISNYELQRLIRIEVDEVARINRKLGGGKDPVEAWVGITSSSRSATLDNLRCALESGADAAVIAPLSIPDVSDVVSFFQREVTDLFDRAGRWIPVFLYDNANIAIDPRVPHIRTRDVKRLSRLHFLYGLKVSASRRVLGNYTKGAQHYKDKGEFGIYVGNAMLMFEVFKLEDGLAGRIREYWNRYLLHNELPIGIVSGPANALPREWQRAWRACYAGDEKMMAVYRSAFQEFSSACRFLLGGKQVSKSIACLKHALKLEGVIQADRVATGTLALGKDEARQFEIRYKRIRESLASQTDPIWVSRQT
jgi:dihydrodipicolinate synthase/N-acetylneuraminate lyase